MNLRVSRLVALLPAVLLAAAPIVHAEEGMWTFDNPPLKQLAAKYNFHPTQAWLDHLRLSSVRLNDGGSGSFVSPDGLLLTNHHVARGQLQKASTAQHDYIRDGFLAKTQADEMVTPDLEVNVLVSMENVTDRIQGAGKGVADASKAMKAREAEIAKIESESKQKTGLRSDVVALYNGGEYWLYRYKAYTDVRIVFAPEQQAAFYGGDPDNFTFPRYDLDMAIFRVYENGKPIHCDNYLKWSAAGPSADELVFISGHPGGTSRQETMAELLAERDVRIPATTAYLQHRLETAQAFAALGEEQNRRMGSTIFGLQNSLKVYIGRAEALKDPALVAKKQAEENDFRAKVNANPAWKAEFGGAWDQIAAAEKISRELSTKQIYRRADSRLLSLALMIVQYVAETKLPDGDRLPQYHEAGLGSLKLQLLSRAPVYMDVEKTFMKAALNLGQEKLGKNDEWLQAVLQGKSVDATVDALVDGTKLADPAVRKALIEGGPEAIAASTDPMIMAARRIDPISRAIYKEQIEKVSSIAIPAGEKLGKARFQVYGKNAYPDATFTLRFSYGTVTGYPYNGTIAQPITTYYGLYDRAAGFANKPPFNLTPRQEAQRANINLSTPLNFVATGDIIGGNSGSPVVNRAGELVGLIFDGNIESLAGDYVYDGRANRAVAVHSSGMIEGMRKLYGANALADEMEGKK